MKFGQIPCSALCSLNPPNQKVLENERTSSYYNTEEGADLLIHRAKNRSRSSFSEFGTSAATSWIKAPDDCTGHRKQCPETIGIGLKYIMSLHCPKTLNIEPKGQATAQISAFSSRWAFSNLRSGFLQCWLWIMVNIARQLSLVTLPRSTHGDLRGTARPLKEYPGRYFLLPRLSSV